MRLDHSLTHKAVSVDPNSGGKAVLLTTSTEVSIAPKSRAPLANGQVNGAGASAMNRPKASGAASSEAQTKGKSKVPEAEDDVERRKKRMYMLRQLPPRILPHYSPTCSALEAGTVLAIGFVAKELLYKLSDDHASDEPPKPWVAKVFRLAPPVDPSALANSPNVPAPPAPRVLLPSDPGAPKTSAAAMAEKLPENDILVGWSPDVPVPIGHISIYGTVSGNEDWDQVK